RWGPLWKCATPEHSGLFWGEGCYWPSPLYWDYMPGGKPCSWCPIEAVSEFLWRSQQANALLKMFTEAERTDYVMPKTWERYLTLHVGGELRTPQRLQAVIARTINYNLRSIAGPYVEFRLGPTSMAPKLEVVSGSGFIHAVWLEMAQSLCNAYGF